MRRLTQALFLVALTLSVSSKAEQPLTPGGVELLNVNFGGGWLGGPNGVGQTLYTYHVGFMQRWRMDQWSFFAEEELNFVEQQTQDQYTSLDYSSAIGFGFTGRVGAGFSVITAGRAGGFELMPYVDAFYEVDVLKGLGVWNVGGLGGGAQLSMWLAHMGDVQIGVGIELNADFNFSRHGNVFYPGAMAMLEFR